MEMKTLKHVLSSRKHLQKTFIFLLLCYGPVVAVIDCLLHTVNIKPFIKGN